ncbi:MAG TPA: rhodanese-like domain-containing protein [Gemmatimonadaceae bacterium]|nr:rhodanese-like domain-containing protein [Gemmatimonadaceae bacterium]
MSHHHSARGAGVAAALLLTAAAAAAPATAQPAATDPRAALVVDAAWLAQHLHDPDLVLLHVGEKSRYDAAHIPGARHVPLSAIDGSGHSGGAMGDGPMLELPATDVLRERLAVLGISDDSRIVVYYGEDWVTPATRVVFTLDHAGLGARTSLLDGGMAAWQRAGGTVTRDVPAVKPGRLSPLRTRALVVDAPWVRAHVGRPGYAVLDARARAFYDGVQTGGGPDAPHRAGHVPGARSLPYSEIATDDLTLRAPAALAALFREAGVAPGDTVVAYCHIGQQATAVLFAARTLGHPVLLYDGSFEDWSARRDYPVETGAPSSPGRRP